MQSRLHHLLPVTLIALAVALFAAGCGSSGDASSTTTDSATTGPTKVTLALDWYPNPDHVGIYAGIDKGFFARAGLDVTPLTPADVSDPIKFVGANRADLGVSYEPEVFYAAQKEIPVAAVAALVPTALNSIIARTDRGIHTINDLRGKTIGVDGSTSTTAYVNTMLKTAGIPADSVHLVTVGFNLLPALLSGRVDAIAGGFQNIEGIEARAHGLATTVFPVDQYGVPRYDELVIVANRPRMKKDPVYRKTVRKFVAALTASTAWARAHPQDAVAIMRAHSSRDYLGQIDKSVPATLRLLRTSALNRQAWTRFGHWMWAQGLLNGQPDGARLIARP